MFKDKNNQAATEKESIKFFVGMLVAGAAAIIAYLAATGNTPQSFSDVINEFTAIHGSNKSAERALFYIFSLLGIVAYAFFYFWRQKTAGADCVDKGGLEEKPYLYVIVGLSVFAAVRYFVYLHLNSLLLAAMIMAVILSMIDGSLIIPGMAYLFISSYAFCGIYRIYVLAGGHKSLSSVTVALWGILSSVLFLLFDKADRKKMFLRGILVAQLIVPFSMLIYLASRYKYGENYVSIHVPVRVRVLVWWIIALFVIEAALKLKRKWSSAADVGKIVTYGACISIMSFNRYSGPGSIIPTDLHHPFENIIGFSQIFELGQDAFAEYVPISGMYSVVNGFFLWFFGHGQFSFYHLTTNIFYLAVITLIVTLMKQQLKGEWALLVSVIFTVMDYNRVAFIVPVMLLLAWPKLIEMRNLWLKAWFLSSFLHGLYYPVFGAAACIGFMPLGIWQIAAYVKSDGFKKDIRKASFWIWWIACCVPVGLGLNALIGTVRHIKAMGSQTVYADGITRFGQKVPGDFFLYIQSLPTRLVMYYLFSFLIVTSLVWMSAALCLRIGNVRVENRRIVSDNPVPALVSLSFGIALLVSFSFTVVRLDIGNIYARSIGVVYAAFVMLVLIVGRYMQGIGSRFWAYGLAVFAMSVVTIGGYGAMESDSKLSAYYTVPDNYAYAVDDTVERLGECFVEQGTYDWIENTYAYASGMDKDDSYLGVVSNLGLYYLCGIKGDATMDTYTIRGYDSAKETIGIIRDNGTIVGTYMRPVDNYYLYYWLMSSGEYVWNPDTGLFVPNDGSVSLEDAQARNKQAGIALDGVALGRTAGSWGKSMGTLWDIFSNPKIGYELEGSGKDVSVSFRKAVDGNDADFMYVEFAGQDKDCEYTLFDMGDSEVQDADECRYVKGLLKKDYSRDTVVAVSWTDDDGTEQGMSCGMDQGRLLIPLGGGRGWLLNEHSGIKISVTKGGEAVDVPEITDIKMLKLREAG